MTRSGSSVLCRVQLGCSVWYPSETHFKHKSCEIWFAPSLFCSYPICLNFAQTCIFVSINWAPLTTRLTSGANPTLHTFHIPYAPLCKRNVHMCADFCYKMMYCGVIVWCNVEFVWRVYWMIGCVYKNTLVVPNSAWKFEMFRYHVAL